MIFILRAFKDRNIFNYILFLIELTIYRVLIAKTFKRDREILCFFL